MRDSMEELRKKQYLTLRIDRIRSARANFYRIDGPFFCITKGR